MDTLEAKLMARMRQLMMQNPGMSKQQMKNMMMPEFAKLTEGLSRGELTELARVPQAGNADPLNAEHLRKHLKHIRIALDGDKWHTDRRMFQKLTKNIHKVTEKCHTEEWMDHMGKMGTTDLLVEVVCQTHQHKKAHKFMFMCLHGVAELCMNRTNAKRLRPKMPEFVPVLVSLLSQNANTEDQIQTQAQCLRTLKSLCDDPEWNSVIVAEPSLPATMVSLLGHKPFKLRVPYQGQFFEQDNTVAQHAAGALLALGHSPQFIMKAQQHGIQAKLTQALRDTPVTSQAPIRVALQVYAGQRATADDQKIIGPDMITKPSRVQCCEHCGIEGGLGGVKLKLCSGCAGVKYCGRTCQIEHWPLHKTRCKAAQAAKAAAKS